ncbi:MAG: hypothetical protein JWM27_5056 [Gemmatimonadetes bacterium]|nr:hypothetical protein [Gemmatimonadota bacterium]
MKLLRTAALVLLLPACAHLHRGQAANPKLDLWNRAQLAFYADSFRVATTLFQQLAAGYPHTVEGREAHFFLGATSLDPRNPAFDARAADEQLGIYLAPDTAVHAVPFRRTEATVMQRLAQEFRKGCDERITPLRCGTRMVERRASGDRNAERNVNGASPAEVERLQGIVADRDAQIQRMREELDRIRNTLVPRKP